MCQNTIKDTSQPVTLDDDTGDKTTPISYPHPITSDRDTNTHHTLTDDMRYNWDDNVPDTMVTEINMDFDPGSVTGVSNPLFNCDDEIWVYHTGRGIWEPGTIYGM